MGILEVLHYAIEMKASDVHITVALPPVMRINGILKPYGDICLTDGDITEFIQQILSRTQLENLEKKGEVDFSYILPDVSRFRVNVFKKQGSYCMAFRIIGFSVPSLDELEFPEILKELALKPRGLLLVTGPTGSGKTTTLAAMVNQINFNRNCHILTLEEPIEYLHKHRKSMINQREIGSDSISFENGLRAALREDPDVILVGEMRDLQTIAVTITAAETGHFVMSTLHTIGAAQTIERIIDVFPARQQQQVRIQLASTLKGVISQQLITTADGTGRVAALEIMIANDAICNLIREGKIHLIPSVIQTGTKLGMKTMDYSLSELVKSGTITLEKARASCVDIEMLMRYIN